MTIQQKNSPFYHHEDKGCNLIEGKMLANRVQTEKKEYMNCQWCKTHEVYCCKCGWEWGHHPNYLKI